MDLPVRVLGHTPPPPLPGVRQWWGNDEADNGLYLRHGMGLTPAAVMSELFTPAFVEVRGCVLLRHRFSERNFLTWWDKLDGDVAAGNDRRRRTVDGGELVEQGVLADGRVAILCDVARNEVALEYGGSRGIGTEYRRHAIGEGALRTSGL